jgi:hypothetical protein
MNNVLIYFCANVQILIRPGTIVFTKSDLTPGEKRRISPRFDRAPDVSPVFLQDSTTRPARGPIFLQDSTAHPTQAPYFSKIRPRTRREVPHFSKIRPRTRREVPHFSKIRPHTRRGRDIWEIFNPRISGSSPIPIGTQPSHPSIPRA